MEGLVEFEAGNGEQGRRRFINNRNATSVNRSSTHPHSMRAGFLRSTRLLDASLMPRPLVGFSSVAYISYCKSAWKVVKI